MLLMVASLFKHIPTIYTGFSSRTNNPLLYSKPLETVTSILRPTSYTIPISTNFKQRYDNNVCSGTSSVATVANVTDAIPSFKRPIPAIISKREQWLRTSIYLNYSSDDLRLVSPPRTKRQCIPPVAPPCNDDSSLFGDSDSACITDFACAISPVAPLNPSSYRGFHPIHHEVLCLNPSQYWLPDYDTVCL
jgi:hypothetical protein